MVVIFSSLIPEAYKITQCPPSKRNAPASHDVNRSRDSVHHMRVTCKCNACLHYTFAMCPYIDSPDKPPYQRVKTFDQCECYFIYHKAFPLLFLVQYLCTIYCTILKVMAARDHFYYSTTASTSSLVHFKCDCN